MHPKIIKWYVYYLQFVKKCLCILLNIQQNLNFPTQKELRVHDWREKTPVQLGLRIFPLNFLSHWAPWYVQHQDLALKCRFLEFEAYSNSALSLTSFGQGKSIIRVQKTIIKSWGHYHSARRFLSCDNPCMGSHLVACGQCSLGTISNNYGPISFSDQP